MDRLLKALSDIAKDASKLGFYQAEKSEADLFYLYGAMAFSYFDEHYCKLPWPQIEKRYDGFEWRYQGSMETGQHPRIGIGTQSCVNNDDRGSFSHKVYCISGVTFRQMMYDNYITACIDILCDGSARDIDSAAAAIQDGYIVKRADGSFFITIPFFAKEQKAEFDAIADKYLAPLMPEYSKIVDRFIAGYKKLFPKHLNDDADRACRNMFLGLYEAIIRYAQRTGAVQMPSPGCCCDVLIQSR